MELGQAGLFEQPFSTNGRPLILVPYAAQQAAIEFLGNTYSQDQGLGLFHGPSLSGKTANVRHFGETLSDDAAVAVVDAAGLNTTALMEAVLAQFGYDLQFGSLNELINMVKVFVLQQAASDHVPLLVIENTHALHPRALRVLCELAELRVRHRCALRMILASDRSISSIVEAPAMAPISQRVTGDFHLEPLTVPEATDYLHAKLRAGGCLAPDAVLPPEICAELHQASAGWPGVLDHQVLLALDKADSCPIKKDDIESHVMPNGKPTPLVGDPDGLEKRPNGHDGAAESSGPTLFLSCDGRTLREIALDDRRVLVGRSDHNDLPVNSRFVSRHHALFIRHGAATFLMDLNSTNGTYVNSRRVSNHVLVHGDVISIGNHRLKFDEPNAGARRKFNSIELAETVIMHNVQDMRKLLARENSRQSAKPVDVSSAHAMEH